MTAYIAHQKSKEESSTYGQIPGDKFKLKFEPFIRNRNIIIVQFNTMWRPARPDKTRRLGPLADLNFKKSQQSDSKQSLTDVRTDSK